MSFLQLNIFKTMRLVIILSSLERVLGCYVWGIIEQYECVVWHSYQINNIHMKNKNNRRIKGGIKPPHFHLLIILIPYVRYILLHDNE